ncbi:hypothetical protein CLM73_16300 [Achromobacter spanius]|uniref:Uncharacterized protein n=2 Tax=Achromobacter spanius TaxID=217203 RepID=A0A2S0I939_9BURK|nr:hypothetical protein CLM73_16300 [Achromobacter spanius]
MLTAFAFDVFMDTTPWFRPFPHAMLFSSEAAEQLAQAGSISGFLLGMLIASTRTIPRMILLSAICMAGFLAVWLIVDAPVNNLLEALTLSLMKFIGSMVRSTFLVALMLTVASVAVDRYAFGGAFVVVSVCEMIHYYAGLSQAKFIYKLTSAGYGMLVSAIAMGIALVLLITVRTGFDAPPKARCRPLKPVPRRGENVSWIAALLWSVMGVGIVLGSIWPLQIFYVAPRVPVLFFVLIGLAAAFVVGLVASVHWFYRISGELAFVHPSSKLFTPRAAVLFFLLAPLSTPLLLWSLGSALRDAWSQCGSSSRRSSKRFNMWCVLFPPIAMGIVQDQVNELARIHAGRESLPSAACQTT